MTYLRTVKDPYSIITPIENGITFPEKMDFMLEKYEDDIQLFKELVNSSSSSSDLLHTIRSGKYDKDTRMTFLKIFRRCVSLVCDTETTKKIQKVKTETLIDNYGHTFKPIETLQENFKYLSRDGIAALAMLVGEYDDRGQLGYILTDLLFSWIEKNLPEYNLSGPRGAGKDIELSSVFKDFKGEYPCDFIIKDNGNVLAIGFARYDSTRGGAQSDDRTGGNEVKVYKAMEYASSSGRDFKIIFIADGPGLCHVDTWESACQLDDSWDGRVRVSTLKLLPKRITKEWLTS